MGRAKLEMKLISNDKSRLNTFKKRKEGLLRKIHELTTLCDVSACLIVYGPDQIPGSSVPETWPEDRKEVHRVISMYRAKNKNGGHCNYGLAEYLNERKRKIEEELSKARKRNRDAKYPTWLDFMDSMPESGLRDFASSLRIKADQVKSRIDLLRLSKQGLAVLDNSNAGPMGYGDMAAGIGIDQSQVYVPNYYPPLDCNSFFQFGGASTSGGGGGGELYGIPWNGPNQYYGGAVQMGPGPLPYAQVGPDYLKMDGVNQGGFQMPFDDNNNSCTGNWFYDF